MYRYIIALGKKEVFCPVSHRRALMRSANGCYTTNTRRRCKFEPMYSFTCTSNTYPSAIPSCDTAYRQSRPPMEWPIRLTFSGRFLFTQSPSSTLAPAHVAISVKQSLERGSCAHQERRERVADRESEELAS